ncbi:hypothetical protein M3Y97_00279500 [Aphelenchoides bicaudatus]|nr:hypothetical protein M3Y97_00279500 [Aphelenchoides bicaudatus]
MAANSSETKETLFASDVLVHIGNQEIESIRDKEQKLERARNETERLNAENEQREESIKSMTKERDQLRELLEENTKKLNQDVSTLTISHKKTSRTIKEYESVKHRIDQIRARREDLRQQISKQQDYFEDISKKQINVKVHERTMRRQSVDNKLSLAENSRQTLDDTLKRDAKTIRELEIYLAKITKQIYDRQREIDDLKLGQLDRKAETEGLKRTIKNIESKKAQVQKKYMKTVAVRDRIQATYRKEVRGDPTESEIEVERLKRKLKEEEDQIQLFDRKIEKAEEEGRFLERGYISTHNKLLEKHLKLAEINAENNVLHNRIERFRVLSQSLMSGDALAYIIGAPEIGAEDEQIAENEGIEGIIKRKEQKLLQVKLELTKVKQEVAAKRSILQSSKNSAANESEQSELDLKGEMKSSRSVPDITRDPKVPKSQLTRFDMQRKEILVNQEKEAMSDLGQRKQKLMDEVSLLTTQTNHAVNEYDRLLKDIEHEEEHARDLKVNLEQTRKTFEEEERRERERLEKIQKEKEARMNALYQALAEIDVKLYKEETKRNDLHEEIRQAEVDRDNLRNRYHTYKGLRQSQQASVKQLESTQNTVDEWRQRVENSQKDLTEMRNMLALSVNRNREPRQQLATLKPYYNEVLEQQALTNRKKELLEQIQRLRRQETALSAEKSGEITFDE